MADQEQLEILKQGVNAWNEWRRNNPGKQPDLNCAQLSGYDLSGADLRGANLVNADLTDAKLTNANLVNANLTDANLTTANLHGANLSSADLTGANFPCADLGAATSTRLHTANLANANLTRANLVGADLRHANLTGANFNTCELWVTTFGNNDLSAVRGLESVIHHGPSSIGIDTFFRSKGKISKVFLRGAGVPEMFIQYAASLAATPFEFYSCFISYSHADKPFARRLHDALQSRGIRCWFDEKQLQPGDHIHREVDEAVRLWDKVLLCCSKASLVSWWVDKEISKALEKEEQLWKERGKQVLAIIPLNLDGYMFEPQWQDWKKQHLTDRLAADFSGWEKDHSKFEAQFERVVKALRADASAREQPPKSRL
jgi:uncharacterized protein YjbI with pentapeptide repeats